MVSTLSQYFSSQKIIFFLLGIGVVLIFLYVSRLFRDRVKTIILILVFLVGLVVAAKIFWPSIVPVFL
ncbi:MAG TPA: hypothetical protein VFE88_03575 [Candidatus Nanoarchaeia archaeon]|nr:hypothetical protein [Candidatus Nanoarchaeia archaeon]